MLKLPFIQLLFLILLVPGLNSISQANNQGAIQFPQDFVGTWDGELEIFFPGTDREPESVGFRFQIQPTEEEGQWHWRMQYAGQQLRDYLLIEENAEMGLYKIDEGNSIVLDGQYANNMLLFNFGMGDATFFGRYIFQKKDEVVFEILTIRDEGSETGGDQGAPVVKNYNSVNFQTATLRRVQPPAPSEADSE